MDSIRFLLAVVAAFAVCERPVHGQIDPSGDWRTWHTEHFRVHAKSTLAAHALRAGAEAERAFIALATELRPPTSKVDLVLSDDVDFSNGFANVLPSNRITVNLAPPGTSGSTGVYDNWLRLVITHELAHIFHLDRADGIWRVLQRVFGRAPGLFPNAYQPEWVSEGIATYYESRFTMAGRMRGGSHEQLLSSAARDGNWPGSGEAVRANVAWPSGVRPYAWGSRFFQSQRTLHGDSVVPQFIQRTSRQLNVFRVSGPMKGAGGESVEDGWEKLRIPAPPPSGEYRVVVRGLRSSPKVRISPDGTRVAYIREDGKSDAHVVVRDVESGAEIGSHRLTSAEDVEWIGETLYVTQLEFLSPVEIRSDLYCWEPGGRWSRASRGGRHTSVFSAGNGRIGTISLKDGARYVGVQTPPDTTVAEFPVPMPAADWGRITVSPNGRWVAGARHANQQWDIVLWSPEHPGGYRMVTDDAPMDADPSWSIDGGRLLFTSERDGIPQIFAYELETGRTERVTNEATGARHPAELRDGTLLFATIFGDGHALVRQTRAGGTTPTLVAGFEAPSKLLVPDIEMRETEYSPWAAMRPHFWIPIAHDEARAGLFIGALTFGADALGRTQYSAVVTAAPERRRLEGVFYLAHKRWRYWTLEVAAGQTWDYDQFLLDASIVPVSLRERAAEVGMSYQWLRWRSGVEVRAKGFVEHDDLINEGVEPLPYTHANPIFGGAALSATAASLSRPILSISPENGVSVQGAVLRRWQLDGSRFWSYELRGAVSGYLALPLPGFSHWVLAATLAAGRTGGTAPTTYSVGGESGDIVEFVPGTSLGSGRRTFQMRAYGAVGGFTRAVVGVAELRVPVKLVARGVPGLPLFLDRLSFNVFCEVGNGWREGEPVNLTDLSDLGGEAAVDLGIGAGFALRVRLGGAVALSDGLGVSRGNVRYFLAFGRAF